MKSGFFAAAVFVLLAPYIFGGSAMASDTPESPAGTWVEVDPERKSLRPLRTHASSGAYRVLIQGNNIVVKEGDAVLVDTTFRMDTTHRRHIRESRLLNIQRRENWQDYSGDNQYVGSFGLFDMFEYKNGVLIGVVFIHDLGRRELLFKRE